MRAWIPVLVLAAAGCGRSNPYDTGRLERDLERRDEEVVRLEREEQAARLTSRTHEYKGMDHELSDWRAAVVDKADERQLRRLREEGSAREADLAARERAWAALGDPVSAEALVDLRRALALERAKLALVDAKLK